MGSACNIESQPTTCQVLRPLVVLETAPSAEVNKMLIDLTSVWSVWSVRPASAGRKSSANLPVSHTER